MFEFQFAGIGIVKFSIVILPQKCPDGRSAFCFYCNVTNQNYSHNGPVFTTLFLLSIFCSMVYVYLS